MKKKTRTGVLKISALTFVDRDIKRTDKLRSGQKYVCVSEYVTSVCVWNEYLSITFDPNVSKKNMLLRLGRDKIKELIKKIR